MEQNPGKEKDNKAKRDQLIVNQPNECIIKRTNKLKREKNNITEMRESVQLLNRSRGNSESDPTRQQL